MPTNQTSNYNLSQWVKSDQVRMEDFNADNAKIDAALAGLNSGKADKSTVSSLQSSLSSQITTLQNTASSQGTALSLRNCCFVTGSYTGTGESGADHPNTITFPRKPVFIHICSDSDVYSVSAVRGQDNVPYYLYPTSIHLDFTWGAKSVSWYMAPVGTKVTADGQLNYANLTYYYFAILEV